MNPQFKDRLERFQSDILALPIDFMVKRHITFGDCFALKEDSYFNLKIEIAEHFKIHPNEVLMVGSGKLGFSIVRAKRYKPFDDSSDIDIAIISSPVFDAIWHDVYNYSLSGSFWPDERQFKEYLFRGWIRPDKLPPSRKFELSREWWEFFRNLTSKGAYGPYKISAGLYRNWHFLETYLSICIGECAADLEEKNG